MARLLSFIFGTPGARKDLEQWQISTTKMQQLQF